MKKNTYEKYTIAATYLAVILFGAFAHGAPARDINNDGYSDSTSKYSLFNMQATDKSQRKPHIGLQLGAVNPEYTDPATEFGIEVGYQPYIPLAAAIELSTFSSDDNAGDFRRTNLMAKGTYNFGGSTPIIRHSFIGAAIGPIYDSYADDNELNAGVKFLAGFDFPLTGNRTTRVKSFSLGAAANYLVVANAQDNFLVNGQLKYWF